MRRRITFLQEPRDSVNPETLTVTNDSFETRQLKAAREDRITFGFDELPQELYQVLKASYEIHIRWVSEVAYDGLGPLVSRMSPGLHIFYTPQKNSTSLAALCPLLRRMFGDIDCDSPEKSFTNLPTERFSLSAATQYYSPLPSLKHFIEYKNHRLCIKSGGDCASRFSSLDSVAALDLDFDTISHAFTVTSFWPSQLWNPTIKNPNAKERLEVGVLSVAPPQEPEELSLGGFLTVIGEDSKPSPVLFSFPARHHTTGQKFQSRFILPTGLHPTLELSFDSSKPPSDQKTCSLHTHLTLPREMFADKYQLSDPLFLASKNLSSIHYITSPVDLEAPAYAVKFWGSSTLLELAPPSTPTKELTWSAQVPLHLRYMMPNSGTGGQAQLIVPYPVVFWACTADEGSKFPINPFDKVNLGYDGLFGPKTMFYHLTPEVDVNRQLGQQSGLINQISVPVLDLDQSMYVEIGTTIAVLLGFGWVCWCLGKVWLHEGYGANKKMAGASDKKEQ